MPKVTEPKSDRARRAPRPCGPDLVCALQKSPGVAELGAGTAHTPGHACLRKMYTWGYRMVHLLNQRGQHVKLSLNI